LIEQPGQAAPAADPRPPAPEGFEEFFRASFRGLVGAAMTMGATFEEAEDAASNTLTEMLGRWPVPENPFAYARRAVVNNFIKDKARGNLRVARRLVERGHVPRQEGLDDRQLTASEDDEWVADVLSALPSAQREVMECIVKGLDREEIAETLGKTRQAVRRNLSDARVRLADVLHPNGGHKQPRRATGSAGEEAR
jgi:RNA polymerase sigma factor (sigma-70 family)